jgi:hypothetical protein
MNLKKEYIDNVKEIVSNNTLSVNEKMSSLLDKNNSHLIDKTSVILNDLLPRNQEQCNRQIQDTIKQFSLSIGDDIRKTFQQTNGETSLKDFISAFEVKYSSMLTTIQQPIFSFLYASEERIGKNLETLKETSSTTLQTQNKLCEDIGDILGKFKGSTNKGNMAEQQLATVLNAMYPSAEIHSSSKEKAAGDFIMRRIDKPDILFENKEYTNNIPKEEIGKFIRDIDTQNMSGIFMSQNSGIAFKQNFQIDIHKGNVLVYVQFCEYDSTKIRLAVDIVDNLYVKLQEMNFEDSENKMSKDILDSINADFQAFLLQKETMTVTLRDFQKRMASQIDDLKMPALAKYLSTKYASIKDNILVCNICNEYEANGKQSMSAHMRGCKKKNCATNAKK